MKNKQSLTSLHKLSRERPTLPELFTTSHEDADDRSLAILIAADLEAELEGALQRRMVKLSDEETRSIFLDPGSPLGSFSAKIAIGHAFGLFGGNTRADLSMMRKIRNAFAHARRPINFDTPEVEKACRELTTPDRFPNGYPLTGRRASEMRRRYEITGEVLRLSFMFLDDDHRFGAGRIELHPLD